MDRDRRSKLTATPAIFTTFFGVERLELARAPEPIRAGTVHETARVHTLHVEIGKETTSAYTIEWR